MPYIAIKTIARIVNDVFLEDVISGMLTLGFGEEFFEIEADLLGYINHHTHIQRLHHHILD
jgi:hypothetical protein